MAEKSMPLFAGDIRKLFYKITIKITLNNPLEIQ